MKLADLRSDSGALTRRWWRVGILLLAVLIILIAGVAELLAPPHLMLFGLVVVGPVLAAATARPWAVAAVGVLALLVGWGTSTWNGSGGSLNQSLRLWVITGMVLISVAVAYRQQILERHAIRAAEDESMLAGIVESSEDAIMSTDPHGTIMTWNESATRLYGWTAEEAIGRSIAITNPPEHMRAVRPILERLAAGESAVSMESPRIRKDGTLINVSVTASPVRDRHGTVIGAAGIERDVTEQLGAERRRQQILERSARAERLESLGQLAGGIAHDFNNLLAINLNYLEFALEQTTDPDIHNDLARAKASAERARDLTRQLLVFAGKVPTTAHTHDLNTIITDNHTLLERAIGTTNELITHLHPHPLPIHADRSRLEQVLLNLTINARDAMPDGGMIIIETGTTTPDDNPHPHAHLNITDTGTGMPPDVATHVFEPFFTTKTKHHGTGLGLATVYGIITEAGGTITLTTEPGVGTTFRILLPLSTTNATTHPTPTTKAPPGHGQHILVVDDDPDVRQATTRILQRHGYHTTAAADGYTALEHLKQHPYDLLLTDIVMPGMSGYQLAETALRDHPTTLIMLISGSSEDTSSTRRLRTDGVPMIYKPFTAEELLQAVHECTQATAGTTPAAT
ncbi:PAS domain S-box-containing protein [Krasilnikovia cinnamomea]|uniref:histidine kinase n=1 Tax=Krasilnikovia cinnamomea TaxID=349313 RepID=A0A4Q7ZH47_9ACTN|nr:PAS domain S-box protein [Krasilnikovia cinnamomea]RZU49389.1 PAS domain S-box-containing protein [Krasilnikovia cinnamomea]